MTAKFNESAARSLLLNTLPLDDNLDILLASKEDGGAVKTERRVVSDSIDNIVKGIN